MVINQARNNLIDFEIATNPQYIPNWHHDKIAEELEHIEKYGDRDYKILLVSVPPRHGKSQQCSIDFPAWYLGRNPNKEIIIASYSGELAQDFGGKTREKVDGQEYKLIFPEVILKEDEKARGRWRTNKNGSYMAVGVGGPITGRGADILLIDDPIKNREEAESEVIRNKIWDWFTSTAFTRLSPKGVVIIIMTRWHMDDLVGRVLNHSELSKRTKIIKFEAISPVGDILWKERYDYNALMEIKNAVGPYDWASLYQGSPILTENQEFNPLWLRKIPEMVVNSMNVRRFLTIDTAMSKKAQADFTGFCDNRVNEQNYWHLKAWQMKIGPEELVDTIFNLHQSNRYETIGIEKTTYTEGLKPYLDAEQRRRNKFLPIVELSHSQISKEIRIRGLIPRYATGSIFHIEGQCKDLEEQMANFPVGVHDDVLDALAYQLQIADGVKSQSLSINIPDLT
jgi:hypothetical protein